MKILYPFAWAILLSMVSVAADYFLKRASESPHALQSAYFVTGAAMFTVTAFGWVFVLRYVKLATLGAIYSVVTVIGLAVLQISIFNESFTSAEWLGIGLAIASLILLGRFTMM